MELTQNQHTCVSNPGCASITFTSSTDEISRHAPTSTAPKASDEFCVVAEYDCPGMERAGLEKGVLALTKGQRMIVFDDTQEHWWRARDDKG